MLQDFLNKLSFFFTNEQKKLLIKLFAQPIIIVLNLLKRIIFDFTIFLSLQAIHCV